MRQITKCDWLLTVESNIPLTCIFIYMVQTKLVQCIPQLLWGEKERKRRGGGGGKEMCNLFHACLYFEEDILNQNR